MAQELIDVWVFCNVYPIDINSVTRRLERLAKSFKKLNAYPKSRRKGDNYKQLVENFLAETGNLFDIFCADDLQRRKLEEFYKLRMTKSDFNFYDDQKGPRLGRCSNVLEKLLPSNERFPGMTDYKLL